MSESENTNEIEIGEGTFLITRTDLTEQSPMQMKTFVA